MVELGGNIECPMCLWDWEMESDDDRPTLCHKCGYDSDIKDFDEEALEKWEKENSLPFHEQKGSNYTLRTFSEDTNESELVWHRDKEDRVVKAEGKTNWMIQLDNKLPKPLTETTYIPKEMYHRVVKGDGELKVRIHKLK